MNRGYFIKSISWSIISKIIDAIIKFISVPLLLAYFGKAEFGLIALATSVNAYLQLLDLGINTGAIKHFSQWIGEKKWELIDTTARTSITFYGIIGLVNAAVLVGVSFWGMHWFSISEEQSQTLKDLFLILALFSVLNWSSSVFNQLLTANQDIQFIQKVGIIKSIANLILILCTIHQHLSIATYFFWFCAINSAAIYPFLRKSKKAGLIFSIRPKADWFNFSGILKYSLAILAISLFQVSATRLRPIILGIFSSNASDVLAEYRIMETITVFITTIGGMLVTILLPITSRLVLEGDQQKINAFINKATLFTSILSTLLCLPFIIAGEEILELYVGHEYVFLMKWFTVWVLTILFYLHSSPIASLILATGKTRVLVFSSAISCTVSLLVNIFLCSKLEVGSAIVGYLIYITMQMAFYYFYFNGKVLKVESRQVFYTFFKPTAIGLLCLLLVNFFNIKLTSLFFQGFVKCLLWAILYVLCLLGLRMVPWSEMRGLMKLGTNK